MILTGCDVEWHDSVFSRGVEQERFKGCWRARARRSPLEARRSVVAGREDLLRSALRCSLHTNALLQTPPSPDPLLPPDHLEASCSGHSTPLPGPIPYSSCPRVYQSLALTFLESVALVTLAPPPVAASRSRPHDRARLGKMEIFRPTLSSAISARVSGHPAFDQSSSRYVSCSPDYILMPEESIFAPMAHSP